MPKMIEISAAEYERLNDCILEDGMRIAALIEENKALHQDVRRLTVVEVAPVVHGAWKPDPHCYNVFYCSACESPFGGKRNYCPNCGAKMDGEGKSK